MEDDYGEDLEELEDVDAIEELAAEVAAAAEAAELRDTGNQVIREHEQQLAQELNTRRESRMTELYDWTLHVLERLQSRGPIVFGQSSSMEQGARPINVRWERSPGRHIVLDFNPFRGTIRVSQLTTAEGNDISGGQVSREIDAVSEDAKSQIEQAIRWTWEQGAGPRP